MHYIGPDGYVDIRVGCRTREFFLYTPLFLYYHAPCLSKGRLATMQNTVSGSYHYWIKLNEIHSDSTLTPLISNSELDLSIADNSYRIFYDSLQAERHEDQ